MSFVQFKFTGPSSPPTRLFQYLVVQGGASTIDPAVVCYRSETTSRRVFKLVGAGLSLDKR